MSTDFYVQLAVWSQVAGSIAFIVVLVFLWIRFVAPAVVAAQERKNAELLESERRRDAAKEKLEGAQTALRAADDDVRAIGTRAERDARGEAERILAEASAESERLVRVAGGELERRRASARDELRIDLIEKALAIARTSAATIDDATNERLIGETVGTIEREGKR